MIIKIEIISAGTMVTLIENDTTTVKGYVLRRWQDGKEKELVFPVSAQKELENYLEQVKALARENKVLSWFVRPTQ